MSERTQRRLAAVVAADIVGSALAAHGGRIADTAGDCLLLEFPSVVDAVCCALTVQQAMAERYAGVPEDRRIMFRVGINVGDVVADGTDLLGDGVGNFR